MSIFPDSYIFEPLDSLKYQHLIDSMRCYTLRDKDLLRIWAYEVRGDRRKASRIFRAAERLYIEERKKICQKKEK